jgi:hypothetical protein
MAKQYEGFDVSGKANDDMSDDQYLIVKVSDDNEYDTCSGTTDVPAGVLQSGNETGQGVIVRVSGYSKVEFGESVSAGALVGTAADGQAVEVTAGSSTTAYILGQVVNGVDAAGEVGEIIIMHGGRAS